VKKIIPLLMALCCCILNTAIATAEENGHMDSKKIVSISGLMKNDANIFSDEFADTSYDFTKVKKIYISNPDTSLIEGIKFDSGKMYAISESKVKKPMKRKIVNKEEADVILDIQIKAWKSTFSHRVPERYSYEKTETYWVWEREEEDWFHYQLRRDREARLAKRQNRKPRHIWRETKQVRKQKTRVRTSDEPFDGARKITHSPYDVFDVEVTANFNLIDTKTNDIILRRKGTLAKKTGIKDYQMDLYEKLCGSFCDDYKNLAKQIKKKYKETRAC